MMQGESPNDIQLEQDLAYQHREWKIERIGWMVMGMVIIAACLGLFGGTGPLLMENKPFAEKGGGQLEYPRFGRYQSASVLRFHHMPVEGGEPFRIWLDEAYLQHFQIEQITPKPEAVTARDGRLVYSFGGQPREVTFTIKAGKIGMIEGEMGIAGETHAIRFRQFIYP